jgi:hypothetical protein
MISKVENDGLDHYIPTYTKETHPICANCNNSCGVNAENYSRRLSKLGSGNEGQFSRKDVLDYISKSMKVIGSGEKYQCRDFVSEHLFKINTKSGVMIHHFYKFNVNAKIEGITGLPLLVIFVIDSHENVEGQPGTYICERFERFDDIQPFVMQEDQLEFFHFLRKCGLPKDKYEWHPLVNQL